MNCLRAISYQWLATAYVSVLSIGLSFVLGRTLGPILFGRYSFILSIVSIYYILQEGGFRTLLFREGTSLSKNLNFTENKLLGLAIGHVIVASLSGVIVVTIVPLNFRWEISSAIVCFGLLAVSGFCSARMKSEGLFEKEAVWQIILRTSSFLCIIAAIICGSKNISVIFLLWSIGIAFALTLPTGRYILKRPEFKINKEIYSANSAFLAVNAATVIYFRCDMVLLEYLGGGTATVGEYAAAYRLMEGVIVIMTPVAHIAFRHMRLNYAKKEYFNRIFLSLTSIMMVVGAIIYLIGTFVGGDIVDLIFGREYSQAHYLIVLLLMALIFILPNYIITQAMIALNKEKIYAYTAIAAAILNIIGNLYMIPLSGAKGAAMVTVATEAFLFFVLGYVYLKWLTNRDF